MSYSSVYSFVDNQVTLQGPGGSAVLGGDNCGAADEGFTVEPFEEKDTMTTGAAGDVVHNLHATTAGKITLRLLASSPMNAVLSGLYNYQTSSSLFHGQNVLSFKNPISGDSISARQVAFARQPTITFAKEASVREWEFNAGQCTTVLGAYGILGAVAGAVAGAIAGTL